jgi:hypothetical protein
VDSCELNNGDECSVRQAEQAGERKEKVKFAKSRGDRNFKSNDKYDGGLSEKYFHSGLSSSNERYTSNNNHSKTSRAGKCHNCERLRH